MDKQNRDRLVDREQTDSSGWGGRRDWAKKEREKELMDAVNSDLIAGGGGWVEVEEGVGG